MTEEVAGVLMGALSIICLFIALPLIIIMRKRLGAVPQAAPQVPTADIVARLERMENAIEAIGTQVERVAEGQRFATKLLSESGRPAAVQVRAEPARIDAPRA